MRDEFTSNADLVRRAADGDKSARENLERRAAGGDGDAREQLFLLLYKKLRGAAHNLLRRQRGYHTLQTTALVHEAFFRAMGYEPTDTSTQANFFPMVVKAMRNLFIDALRKGQRIKHGGGRLVAIGTLIEDVGAKPLTNEALIDLDRALTEFQKAYPLEAKVVEMRFFGGMSVPETALALGYSESKVKREFEFARAWLNRRLKPDDGTPPATEL